MRRKLLHVLLAVATFTVVWLVTSEASAFTNRAPVCDPRGAIGFAPPPQFQDLELSLDIPADCFEVNPLESENVVPTRGGPIDVSWSQEPMSATSSVVVGAPVVARVPIVVVACPSLPPGFRSGLERPPRI